MIYGLGAALAWGFADFAAAIVGRRIGSFAITLVAQIAGFVTIAWIFLIRHPAWTGTRWDVALLAANAVLGIAGYLLMYKGFALGPVALVSPIVAAYAVITIALAMMLLGESLDGLVLAGALVTVLGVVLTATDPRRIRSVEGTSRSGVPYALISSVLFGVATFVMGRAVQRVGWVSALFVGRSFSLILMLALTAVRRPDLRRGGGRWLLGAAAVGLVDMLGMSVYSYGVELGYVSIVTAASATFTLIPVAGGIVLLRERPAASQLLGIALVVAGLLLLGLGG